MATDWLSILQSGNFTPVTSGLDWSGKTQDWANPSNGNKGFYFDPSTNMLYGERYALGSTDGSQNPADASGWGATGQDGYQAIQVQPVQGANGTTYQQVDGGQQTNFDSKGTQTDSFNYKNIDAYDTWDKLVLATIGAMAGGAGLAAMGGGVAGAGAVGGPVGASGTIGTAGVASGAGAGVGSGLAGEVLSKAVLDGTTAFGANSVPGAFELGSMAMPGTAATAEAVAGANSAVPSVFNAAADSQLANVAIDAAGGNSLSAYTSAAIPSVSSIPGGGMEGIMDFLKSNGGLLSSALGALSGSQGQQSEQSSTRTIPPWLLELYLGTNGQQGLLPAVQAQLARSTSPQAMQGWNNVGQVGQGLLNMPVAGNGYAQRGGR